jgi:hypothetical protein
VRDICICIERERERGERVGQRESEKGDSEKDKVTKIK